MEVNIGHILIADPIIGATLFKTTQLKSIRVHFAPAEIAITFELLSQFLRFLDQNDRRSLGVLLIY